MRVLDRPVDASAEGWRIDRLLDGSLAALAVVAVLVMVWIGWALLRWRKQPAVYSTGQSRRAVLIVIAAASLLFIAIDVPLFWIANRDVHQVFGDVESVERDPGAVRIEINAQRWAWNMRLAGNDGVFATDDDVVMLDRMRVPVERPVIVQLASSDVVHSFFVPAFRVRLDAVPGRVQSTWFRPTRPGIYEVACSELCGVFHHQMRGTIEVVSADEFDSWHQLASREALAIAREDRRALDEESTRPTPEGMAPVRDPAHARRWGWPWQRGVAR